MRRRVEGEKPEVRNHNMEDYVENILAENLTLKRKLESKCAAITILNQEVDKLKFDKDNLKGIIDDLKARNLQNSCVERDAPPSDSTKISKLEIELLRQKLRDALGDIQALRSRLSQENRCSMQGDVNVDLSREEKFAEQLESIQRSKMQLEADFQSVLDEKQELITERDAYKCKLHRLNHECNILLKGNTNGIIDLDALIMENRFLQERLIQAQEESQLAKQVSERYKSMLQTKKQKGNVNGDSSAGMLLSQKQVKELLDSCGTTEVPGVDASIPELRSLCLALLDNLGDKTLALTHQKRANRLLAARIAELQSRLEIHHTKQAIESPSSCLLEGYKSLMESVAVNICEDDCKSDSPKNVSQS